MALHSRFVAGVLKFFSGATSILEIDPAGVVNIPGTLKLNGTDVTAALAAANATPVAGIAAGYKVARGSTALGGSNPTTVVTGLTTILSFVAVLKGTAAPGLGTSTLTVNPNASAGSFDVYAWKPTSISNPTLLASTGTETFYWVAIGT